MPRAAPVISAALPSSLMAGNLHGHQQALTAGYVDKAIGAWGSTTLSKSITAPCAISVSRKCSQFIADMLYPCLTLSAAARSEEHTSEIQYLMLNSYTVLFLHTK